MLPRVFIPMLAGGAALLAAACGSSSTSSSASAANTVPASSTSTSSTSSSQSAPASSSSSTTPAATAVPNTGSGATLGTTTTSLGTFLVDPQGMTLYLFEADTTSQSTCGTQCASAWPPLLTTGTPVAGSGVMGSLLGTTTRSDGKVQVTYKGHPLYGFIADKKAGDVNGEGKTAFGANWYVVAAASGDKIDNT